MNQTHYKYTIWTNHALDRLNNRGLTQELVWQAFQYPDTQSFDRKKYTYQYSKKFDQSTITVVTKQNEKKEWIILSCWIDPPLPNSIDIAKSASARKYRHSSTFERIFITIRNFIFGIHP